MVFTGSGETIRVLRGKVAGPHHCWRTSFIIFNRYGMAAFFDNKNQIAKKEAEYQFT